MTPDGWILWYYRTRDTFGAPGLNYVDSTGRVLAEKCDNCKSPNRRPTNEGAWTCGGCNKSWPYVDRDIFKGEVQKSVRRISFDDTNARYFDVATLLHHFLRDVPWDGRMYVANTLGYSTRDLAVKFPAAFPEADGPFSQRTVARRIRRARSEWDHRLRTAGIAVSVY